MREASERRTVTDTDSYAFFVKQKTPTRDDRGSMFSMKQIIHSALRLLCTSIVAIIPFTCEAEKIDNTHYRFCVMDDAEITDYDCLEAYNNNQQPHYVYVNTWSSGGGVRIKAYKNYKDKWIYTDTTQLQTLDNVTSIKVQMTEPCNEQIWSLTHSWRKKVNEVEDQLQHTYIHITVQAPTGISFEDIPNKAVIGDEIPLSTKLAGTFPPSKCGIRYDYSSSDKSVATVSGTRITALKSGKTTISVEASITNQRYGGYYYIGKATAEIEVVDNLDPMDISLSSREFSLDIGQEEAITATLTPEYARTEITWSSSDESVVTVKDGLVKAIGRGNAFVEATTSNGLSAKSYVTVLGDEDYRSVYIDGLYYDLDRTTHKATVVRENDNVYGDSYISGIVDIPGKVEFHGEEYTLTKIGIIAFSNCKITSVTLPATVSVIENDAFFSSTLEDIVLDDGITTIGSGAFMYTNLESFIIGLNVSIIGEGAFANCEELKAVYVDEANPYFVRYNECIYDATLRKLYYVPINSKSITLADGVERIGAYSFSNNHAITTLEFPETLITIGEGGFAGCDNLQKISLPNSLLEIESSAFCFCDNLKEINFGNNLKILGENAFGETKPEIIRINALNPPTADAKTFSDYNAVLVVPLGRTSVYKKHKIWGKFTEITDDEASSGIDDIQIENACGNRLDIYNMQGILIRHDVTENEIKNLPSGLYIINGEKIVVK